MSGCDLFSTRPPEDPYQQSSSFIQPTTPDIVITNFKNSISEYNVDNYVKCFIDSSFSDKNFEFVPAAEAGIDRSIFIGWNRESERQYLRNLGKPPFGNAGLALSNKRIISITSDSVIYYYDYFLYFPHNHPNITKNFSGNLQFYLSVDRKLEWGIYKWFDFKADTLNTWSYLKALFSTGI